jgi:hypothetical protein
MHDGSEGWERWRAHARGRAARHELRRESVRPAVRAGVSSRFIVGSGPRSGRRTRVDARGHRAERGAARRIDHLLTRAAANQSPAEFAIDSAFTLATAPRGGHAPDDRTRRRRDPRHPAANLAVPGARHAPGSGLARLKPPRAASRRRAPRRRAPRRRAPRRRRGRGARRPSRSRESTVGASRAPGLVTSKYGRGFAPVTRAVSAVGKVRMSVLYSRTAPL